MSEPLVRVRDLTVCHRRAATVVLDRVSFDLHRGETIGLLGESGVGKTTLALALIGLLPPDAQVSGSILFDGRELVGAHEQQWRRLRGSGISLISQEPELVLNPVLRVRRQLDEVLRSHVSLSRRERARKVADALTAVGLADPQIHAAYPNQLSGGQRQRAVIAQALIAEPVLLLADEPTSSLDTVAQSEVINLLKALQTDRCLTLLFITHNPGLLTALTSRILSLQGGRINEMLLSASQRSLSAASTSIGFPKCNNSPEPCC